MIMFDDSSPKELGDKIAISLLYYGLLRKVESITLQVKDVSLRFTEEVDVEYLYPTKNTTQGFSFKIPV